MAVYLKTHKPHKCPSCNKKHLLIYDQMSKGDYINFMGKCENSGRPIYFSTEWPDV